MKKKVINALRTSYADKGLNQAELEELADVVSQNLNENASEDEINNAVSGVSGYVNIMQKFGNRCASAVENKYKGYVKPDGNSQQQHNNNNQNQGQKNQDVLTKDVVAEMLKNGIAEALKPYQEKERAEQLKNVLMAQSKLKGIPQSFIKHYKLDDEKNAETLASQIEQEYATQRKEILASMGFADVPPIGNGSGDSEEDFAKRMQDAQKALAPTDSNK